MGWSLEGPKCLCFCDGGTLRLLSSDSSGQLDILWHDGNSPGVNGTQIGVIEQPNKVSLCCFLETQYCRRLEPQVCLVVLGDLPHQPLERQLSDEQCCALLEMTDVIQSCHPCSVPVGFHQPPLHPRLVDLPQLFWSPVQYMVAQYGSFLLARDVKDWQVLVHWGVSCARFAWFFAGHN